MERPKRTIIYRKTEYEICEWAIEELNSIGLEFNDEYITQLLENDSPFHFWGLTVLTHWDVLNRKCIGSNSLLGSIVKLDKEGNILDYFETVYDAVIDSLNSNHPYSFEKLHSNGVINCKNACDFFGMKIKVNPRDNEHDIIKELNTTIRKCKNRYLGKNKIFKKMYTGDVASRMTYDEYVMQEMRYHAFAFAAYLLQFQGDIAESQYTKHNVENCNDYLDRIEVLFQRYSVQGVSVFERVYDLNKIKGYSGIYLLCLPQIKGCYVGKTQKCFATRITQHFTTPNSAFDTKYNPTDIQQIYILQLNETMPFIDLIEEDCIATLGKEICLNVLAGGNSIELIKSDTYDTKKHLLASDLLQWVAQDAFNITQYTKECTQDCE